MKTTIKNKLLADNINVTTRFKTEEGFLDVNAAISRSGIYEYKAGELGITDRDAAMTIRVLRTEDEVFNETSMASFAQKPVTDGHPPELVNSSNSRFYTVGISDKNVIRDGETVATKLRVTDERAVNAIEEGKVQLSCGYRSDIIVGDGNDPTFGDYEAKQTNIRGNHIAIVKQGRAGDTCAIKDKQIQDKESKGVTMLNVIIDGITIEVTPQGKEAIEKLQKSLGDTDQQMTGAAETHKAAIEKLTTDNKAAVDKLQGELDATKKEIPDAEQLDSLVAERTEIVDAAKKVIKDFDATGKTNMDIKKAVVMAKHTDMKLDDATDDYVDGLFTGVTTAFSKGDDNLDETMTKDSKSTGDPVADARNAKIEASKNAHKSTDKKD